VCGCADSKCISNDIVSAVYGRTKEWKKLIKDMWSIRSLMFPLAKHGMDEALLVLLGGAA
jgi:hypothetical protein